MLAAPGVVKLERIAGNYILVQNGKHVGCYDNIPHCVM